MAQFVWRQIPSSLSLLKTWWRFGLTRMPCKNIRPMVTTFFPSLRSLNCVMDTLLRQTKPQSVFLLHMSLKMGTSFSLGRAACYKRCGAAGEALLINISSKLHQIDTRVATMVKTLKMFGVEGKLRR